LIDSLIILSEPNLELMIDYQLNSIELIFEGPDLLEQLLQQIPIDFRLLEIAILDTFEHQMSGIEHQGSN
jgi:hypothetical protein